jgi:hypothetical protein
VVINPYQAGIATLLYGERYQCAGTNKYQWQMVTFDANSAFSNNGQNLPLPHILPLDPITTAQPHTTYSYLIPITNSSLLMAFEQGNTTTTEDIYTTVLSYDTGVSIANGIKLANGVKIQATSGGMLIGIKRTPAITWATPAAITYGTTLSGTQLNATASTPGMFVYNPAAGTTPAVGVDTLSVTFTPTDLNDYTTATASVTLAVNAGIRTTSTIRWATPAAIASGTALSSTQLNATASVGGTFVYNSAAGTIPALGLDTLSVVFTPTDTVDYTTENATAVLTVGDFFTIEVSSSPIQAAAPGTAAVTVSWLRRSRWPQCQAT